MEFNPTIERKKLQGYPRNLLRNKVDTIAFWF